MGRKFIDSLLGHNPDEHYFKFVDEASGEASETQKWTFVPAVGDRINLRNGAEFVVVGRRIDYDMILGVEVIVRIEYPS
ncbi:MAG: hypothetical protein ACK5XS_10190 [Armatimonadota bacterium]|jgi:hypothetical protein|nr:hypothetical protein [Fimbriimonadaceae bacterium]